MSVKSSSTVFRVLRLLAMKAEAISAGELAPTLFIPVTTAARALATLEAAGYAERHQGSSRFVIGKSARSLAYAYMGQFPVRDLAMPYLQQLTLETGLTSSLFVRLGWYVLRIGQILGPNVMIHRTGLGEVHPLTIGAPSLAILANLSGAEFDRAVEAAEGSVNAATLRRTATKIRTAGVAVSASLVEPGTSDVASALLDRRERVVAAVAVEGASSEQSRLFARPESSTGVSMRELAAKIRNERVTPLSHYDHIEPDRITF